MAGEQWPLEIKYKSTSHHRVKQLIAVVKLKVKAPPSASRAFLPLSSSPLSRLGPKQICEVRESRRKQLTE